MDDVRCGSRYARNYSNLDKLNKYIFEEFEII